MKKPPIKWELPNCIPIKYELFFVELPFGMWEIGGPNDGR
jgi:hypothetical protein